MSKVVEMMRLIAERESWRLLGEKVVFTNGCFDLLHVGHVRSLQEAAQYGLLVVGVNGDESVRRLKGAGRPVVLERHRAEMLAALGCVGRVVIFGEDTAEECMRRLQPDVYCKGEGNYNSVADVPEVRVALSCGGSFKWLRHAPGVSTTELIRRCAKSAK